MKNNKYWYTKKRFGMNKKELIRKLILRDGKNCYLCKESMILEINQYAKWVDTGLGKRNKINLNVDHVIPFSISKSNQLGNLRLTHKTCNNLKGDSLIKTERKIPLLKDVEFIKKTWSLDRQINLWIKNIQSKIKEFR